MSSNEDLPIIEPQTAKSICPDGWALAQTTAVEAAFIETLYPGIADDPEISQAEIPPEWVDGPPVTEEVLRQRTALYDLQRSLLLNWLRPRGKWVWAKG